MELSLDAIGCGEVSAAREVIAEKVRLLSVAVHDLLGTSENGKAQIPECELFTCELLINSMLYGVLGLSSEEAMVLKFPSENLELHRRVGERLAQAVSTCHRGFIELTVNQDRFVVRVSDGTLFPQFETLRDKCLSSQREESNLTPLRGRGLQVIFDLVDRSERDPKSGVVTYERLLLKR